MNPSLQPNPRHSHRVPDPILIIHNEFLRDDVDDLPVHGDGDSACCVDHPLHIARSDLLALHGNDPMAVNSLDMSPCNPRKDRGEMNPCHQFCLFDCLLDRLDGAVNVDHHTLSQSL